MAKAKANLADMPDIRLKIMDLLDPGSIDAFAELFLRDNQKLHILVNKAGMMAPPLARDARGYETQFAANHLGHFQLTSYGQNTRAVGTRNFSAVSCYERLLRVAQD
jgi:NAD(P)-dependent dehydrogenase (short-subunit alcohol dehydrogenase family)